MSHEEVEMWEYEYSIETDASVPVIWNLFADVSGWSRWNAGVARAEILGPFAVGTRFLMTLPGRETLTSRLVEVRENGGFVDETCVGEARVFVDHSLEAQENGRTKITYSLQAFGPGCAQLGRTISMDFPDVLTSLAELAESEMCAET
ncbi:MAG TPA: SRPBCC family protein [Opitutaceae bacterium]|nr:SRPBCC family protein [Opitutaceae bacterium]